MKLSLSMIIYGIFFLGSALFGFMRLMDGEFFKALLWMVAIICWVGCIAREIKKNNKEVQRNGNAVKKNNKQKNNKRR